VVLRLSELHVGHADDFSPEVAEALEARLVQEGHVVGLVGVGRTEGLELAAAPSEFEESASDCTGRSAASPLAHEGVHAQIVGRLLGLAGVLTEGALEGPAELD
jgi:hypothetical protein